MGREERREKERGYMREGVFDLLAASGPNSTERPCVPRHVARQDYDQYS
jgi:hypothetical protein